MRFLANVWQLILFRFLQGLGGAMINRPVAPWLSSDADRFGGRRVDGDVPSAGVFIGPPLGGLIIDLVLARHFLLLFVESRRCGVVRHWPWRGCEPLRSQVIDGARFVSL
jgi:MFS family permease